MRLTILRAAAGSGMTYALTMNYLLLKGDSPSYFRSILAGEEAFDQQEDKKGLGYCGYAGIGGK